MRGTTRWRFGVGIALGLAGVAIGAGGAAGQLAEGEALARSLGCGACHRGVAGPGPIRAAAPAFGAGEPEDGEAARARERHPHFELGRTLIRMERYREALPHARRAVEFDPDDASARAMLEDLEEVFGPG